MRKTLALFLVVNAYTYSMDCINNKANRSLNPSLPMISSAQGNERSDTKVPTNCVFNYSVKKSPIYFKKNKNSVALPIIPQNNQAYNEWRSESQIPPTPRHIQLKQTHKGGYSHALASPRENNQSSDRTGYEKSQNLLILPSLNFGVKNSGNTLELNSRELLSCINVRVKSPPPGYDEPVLYHDSSKKMPSDRNENYKKMQLRYNLCQQICGNIFYYEEAALHADDVQQFLYLSRCEYEEADFLNSEISGLIYNSHYSSRRELEDIYALVLEYKNSVDKRKMVDPKEYKCLLDKTSSLASEILQLINKQAIKYNTERLGSIFLALKNDYDEMLDTYNLPQDVSRLNEITKDAKALRGQRGFILQSLERKIETLLDKDSLLNKNPFIQAFLNFVSDLYLLKQVLDKIIGLSDSAELINKHSIFRTVSSYANKAFEYKNFLKKVQDSEVYIKNILQFARQLFIQSFYIENKSAGNLNKIKKMHFEIKEQLNFLSSRFCSNDLKKLLCVSEEQVSLLNNWFFPSDKIEILNMFRDWRISVASFNMDLKKFAYYFILEMLSVSVFQLSELTNKIKSVISLRDMEIAFAVKVTAQENGRQKHVRSIRTGALKDPQKIKVYLSRVNFLLNSILTLLPNMAPWLYEMNIIRPYHYEIMKKNLFCAVSSQNVLNKLKDLYNQQFNYLIKIKILTNTSGSPRDEIINDIRAELKKDSLSEDDLLMDLQNLKDTKNLFLKKKFFQHYRNSIINSLESFRQAKINFCEYFEIISRIKQSREDLIDMT